MEFTPAAEPFAVDDLLDFSNDNGPFDGLPSPVPGPVHSSNSSSLSAADHSDHPFSAPADAFPTFSGDFSLPYDDAAELEWLSNFVEEDSFSSEDLQKLHLISGLSTARPDPRPTFSPEALSVPAKARSKRSRAAPASWASRLHLLSIANQTPPGKKKPTGAAGTEAGEGRTCLHCATDKTPQWRTGPMGPKTLCNACGVRYKSGRLVPEYRPAASPTFVLTKHSNSHRKVMELRRQKEQQMHAGHRGDTTSPQFINGGMVFHVSNPDEYLLARTIDG